MLVDRISRPLSTLLRCCLALAASSLTFATACAQDSTPTGVEERFLQLERIVAEQAEQIRRLSEENRKLTDRAQEGQPEPPATSLPAIVDAPPPPRRTATIPGRRRRPPRRRIRRRPPGIPRPLRPPRPTPGGASEGRSPR